MLAKAQIYWLLYSSTQLVEAMHSSLTCSAARLQADAGFKLPSLHVAQQGCTGSAAKTHAQAAALPAAKSVAVLLASEADTFPKKGIAPHKWPGFAAGFAKRLRHVPESCDLSSYNCTQNSVQYALIIVVSFCLDCSSEIQLS